MIQLFLHFIFLFENPLIERQKRGSRVQIQACESRFFRFSGFRKTAAARKEKLILYPICEKVGIINNCCKKTRESSAKPIAFVQIVCYSFMGNYGKGCFIPFSRFITAPSQRFSQKRVDKRAESGHNLSKQASKQASKKASKHASKQASKQA